MNLTLHEHPPLSDLAAYGLGKLDDRRADRIEEHLTRCAECARTLKDLPDDSLIVLLRDDNLAARDTASPSDVTTALPPRDAATLPPSGDADVLRSDWPAEFAAPPELANHPRYQIVARLGGGGMGQVFQAQHRIMNRPVALKIINPELMNHSGAVERFHREIQAASRLLHPNIVTSYDADQAGALHFFVMEYVEGVDLHRLVQDRGPLPIAEACEYIRQAALGLQHAHEQGMVHRDIKPHNLMLAGLRNDGELRKEKHAAQSAIVKILDFGLANFASETAAEEVEDQYAARHPPAAGVLQQLTQMGTMMGTPDYIAPEQAIDAHAADIRADIYSLGCTFYTLLTGQTPFGEGSVLDKIKAHREQAPPPVSALRPDAPPEVEAIVKTMMAKDPAERFQTPAEVVAALQRFVDQRIEEKHQERDFPLHVPAKPIANRDEASRWYEIAGNTMRWGVACPNILLSVLLAVLCIGLDSRGVRVLTGFAGYLLILWSLVPGLLLWLVTPKVRRMESYRWVLLAAVLCLLPSFAIPVGFPLGCIVLYRLLISRYREPLGVALRPSFVDGLGFAVALLAPLAFATAGVVVYVEMGKTTLKFEIEDPSITVRYEDQTITVENDGEPIRIRRLGDHHFSVERDGFIVRTENFELKKGDRLALRVTTLDGRPQIIAKGPYRRKRQQGFQDSDQRMARAGAKPRPDVKRDLRDRLQSLAVTVRDGFDASELNAWIESEAPLLAVQPPPLPRLALEWLAELPTSEHERLLRDGYLKWDPNKLGPKRDTVETMLQLLLFRKQGMSPSSRDTAVSAPAQAVANLINHSDVGFTIVEVPNSSDAFICWCVIPRQDDLLPVGLPLLGVLERHLPVLQFAQNQRFRELRAKPTSPLPGSVSPK